MGGHIPRHVELIRVVQVADAGFNRVLPSRESRQNVSIQTGLVDRVGCDRLHLVPDLARDGY